MLKNNKVEVAPLLFKERERGTIRGGLDIMAKGLRNWHRAVSAPDVPRSQLQETPKREKNIFPPPAWY